MIILKTIVRDMLHMHHSTTNEISNRLRSFRSVNWLTIPTINNIFVIFKTFLVGFQHILHTFIVFTFLSKVHVSTAIRNCTSAWNIVNSSISLSGFYYMCSPCITKYYPYCTDFISAYSTCVCTCLSLSVEPSLLNGHECRA